MLMDKVNSISYNYQVKRQKRIYVYYSLSNVTSDHSKFNIFMIVEYCFLQALVFLGSDKLNNTSQFPKNDYYYPL